jgi:hypothetical protein
MLDVPQIKNDWIMVGQRVVSIMPDNSRRENVYLDVISPDIGPTVTNSPEALTPLTETIVHNAFVENLK